MRQIPNLRYTARGRPHNRHRRRSRVENFCGLSVLAIFDLLAMQFPRSVPSVLSPPVKKRPYAARNGNPSRRRSSRASLSLSTLVQMVIFIPWLRVNLSGLSSGKTNCSVNPRL